MQDLGCRAWSLESMCLDWAGRSASCPMGLVLVKGSDGCVLTQNLPADAILDHLSSLADCLEVCSAAAQRTVMLKTLPLCIMCGSLLQCVFHLVQL